MTQTEEDYINMGLDVGVYYGNRKEWNKTHTICTWQSLNQLFKDSKSGKATLTFDDFIDGVQCVIIDEVQELLDSSDQNNNVLNEINANIFWALSSIVGDDILTLLNDYLNDNCRIEERKVRFLADAGEEYAVINHEEFWLEPNENQRVKYKETLVECRKELKKVLESGREQTIFPDYYPEN